jgi:hypothetical protein
LIKLESALHINKPLLLRWLKAPCITKQQSVISSYSAFSSFAAVARLSCLLDSQGLIKALISGRCGGPSRSLKLHCRIDFGGVKSAFKRAKSFAFELESTGHGEEAAGFCGLRAAPTALVPCNCMLRIFYSRQSDLGY